MEIADMNIKTEEILDLEDFYKSDGKIYCPVCGKRGGWNCWEYIRPVKCFPCYCSSDAIYDCELEIEIDDRILKDK